MGEYTPRKLLFVAGFYIVEMLTLASASAGGCGIVCAQPVIHHAPIVKQVAKVVDYHQAYQAPVVNYFVGAPVRQEALIAKAMEQAFANFQAQSTTTTTKTKTTLQSVAPQQAYHAQQPAYHPPPPPAGPTFNQTAPQVLQQACAQCHAGDAPQGGFDLSAASPEQWDAAAERVLDGSMPPSGALSQADQEQAAFEAWLQRRKAVAFD